MEILIGLIAIVWGILNIILFFKLWKMCDNVKKLAKDDTMPFKEKFAVLLLSGEKEKAYKLVETNLLHDLVKIYYYFYDTTTMLERMEEKIYNVKNYVERTGYELPKYLSSADNFLEHQKESYKITDRNRDL